jgi:hypothetical protein
LKNGPGIPISGKSRYVRRVAGLGRAHEFTKAE